MAVMLSFGVIGSLPMVASAYSYGGYNDGLYYSPSPVTNRYTYSQSNTPTYVPPVIYQQPTIIQQPVYVTQPVIVQQPIVAVRPIYVAPLPTLNVSCNASPAYWNGSVVGVTWTAYVSGGNGYYRYSWTGSDRLSGSDKTTYMNYTTPGQKIATVTVYGNGQSIGESCSTYVTIPGYNTTSGYPTIYKAPTYTQQVTYVQPQYVVASPAVTSNNSGLDVACYADPTNSKIDQPITWTAEVKGGQAPYTYSWTGSEGLVGSAKSVIKYYGTIGNKSAIVTVTSADGQTSNRACSNALTVTSNYKAPAKVATVKPTVQTSQANVTPAVSQAVPVVTLTPANANLSAASLFSLQNVPWGLVGILIILVLFFTVIYLLFNRTKI